MNSAAAISLLLVLRRRARHPFLGLGQLVSAARRPLIRANSAAPSPPTAARPTLRRSPAPAPAPRARPSSAALACARRRGTAASVHVRTERVPLRLRERAIVGLERARDHSRGRQHAAAARAPAQRQMGLPSIPACLLVQPRGTATARPSSPSAISVSIASAQTGASDRSCPGEQPSGQLAEVARGRHDVAEHRAPAVRAHPERRWPRTRSASPPTCANPSSADARACSNEPEIGLDQRLHAPHPRRPCSDCLCSPSSYAALAARAPEASGPPNHSIMLRPQGHHARVLVPASGRLASSCRDIATTSRVSPTRMSSRASRIARAASVLELEPEALLDLGAPLEQRPE